MSSPRRAPPLRYFRTTLPQPQPHPLSQSHSQPHSLSQSYSQPYSPSLFHPQPHSQAHSLPNSLQSFNYHNISIDKAHSLGSGSYGAVYMAKGDQLTCAAKVMHNILSSNEDPGSHVSLQKFQTECQLLSLVRHPNIVQYLSTSFDEQSGQPVLLMELCEESLTKFLEESPGPLPYHMELSISHDIALALIYLHSNGLIHRDLSSNNVLMDGGRAKVTDFGMSKLQDIPSQTDTLCPGSVHYMPPEALDEPPSYTEKIDVFSFGILLVQIMTRKFPDPGPRFRVMPDPRYPTGIRVPIREVERRRAHLELIDDSHPLKNLALMCLDDNEKNRPTAQELGMRTEQLRASQSLPLSLRNSPRPKIRTWPQSVEGQEPVEHQQMLHQERLEEQLEQLRLQLAGQRVISKAIHKELEKANREVMEERKKLKELSEKENAREKAIMEKAQRMEKEVMEWEQKWTKLQQEVLVLQRSLQQKEETISRLQQAIVARENRIKELEQQATDDAFQTVSPPKSITKLRWEKAEITSEPMSAETALTNVSVDPASSKVVCCFDEDQKWSKHPLCPYNSISPTAVCGLDEEYKNELLGPEELTTLNHRSDCKQVQDKEEDVVAQTETSSQDGLQQVAAAHVMEDAISHSAHSAHSVKDLVHAIVKFAKTRPPWGKRTPPSVYKQQESLPLPKKQESNELKRTSDLNLKNETKRPSQSWTMYRRQPSVLQPQPNTSPIYTASMATTFHPPEYFAKISETASPSPSSALSHNGKGSDISSSGDAAGGSDACTKYVAVLLKPKSISREPWTAYVSVCLCYSGDHVKAVKEHITERYDLDYEVFSQPLQFDNHLKLEVAEEEAKRQGYKITPLIDNGILKKEDIDRNYPYSEQPSGQSVKVDDVYPHKIPLQIQSITDHPEPLDCALTLHGQKDGEHFTLIFRLCNPCKATHIPSESPKEDNNRDILESIPDMSTLMNEVGARSTKWEAVGCELGLDEDVIGHIKADVQETQARFQRVFQEWKKTTPKKTWKMVFKALNAKQVGEHKLAYDLKSKLLEK